MLTEKKNHQMIYLMIETWHGIKPSRAINIAGITRELWSVPDTFS